MRYRRLGDSDIEVSEISLGSWLTYGAGVERDQTEACTRAAFDAGITLFDTSNVYGAGAAEEVSPADRHDGHVGEDEGDRIREHLEAKIENGRQALARDLDDARYLRLLEGELASV